MTPENYLNIGQYMLLVYNEHGHTKTSYPGAGPVMGLFTRSGAG